MKPSRMLQEFERDSMYRSLFWSQWPKREIRAVSAIAPDLGVGFHLVMELLQQHDPAAIRHIGIAETNQNVDRVMVKPAIFFQVRWSFDFPGFALLELIPHKVNPGSQMLIVRFDSDVKLDENWRVTSCSIMDIHRH